jgi:hypothetical protein
MRSRTGTRHLPAPSVVLEIALLDARDVIDESAVQLGHHPFVDVGACIDEQLQRPQHALFVAVPAASDA